MADQIIDRLGVEFFGKVSGDFGVNVQKAVTDFQEKIKPVLNQINSQWKSMAINISAFFRVLQQIPAMDMSKMVNTQDLVSAAGKAFKTIKAESVKEMEELSSGVRKELNKAEEEFRKYSRVVEGLRRGENPIVEWGRTEYTKGKPFWPEAQRAIPEEQISGAQAFKTEQEMRQTFSQAITQYTEKQLGAYQKMEAAIGRIGAFERARIATNEILAKAAQDQVVAQQKIADFEKITQTLMERGIITGKDAAYFQQAKKYLEDIWRTEKDINVLNQNLDDIMGGLIGKDERVRDIIMESLGVRKEEVLTEEKLVELAHEAAKAYEEARNAAIGGPIGGGPSIQAGEWNRLVGVMEKAKEQVSEFQKRVQQINLRGFIKADEFERVQSLTGLINKEIDSLIAKLGAIGSHSQAAKLAESFDRNKKSIDEFAEKAKKGQLSVSEMNTQIQALTQNLMELGREAKTIEKGMLTPAYKQVNDQITALTGGIDINYRSLKRSSLGVLELEKVQGLLKDKLTLIRQEYEILGGKASPALNKSFKETSDALAYVNNHLQVLTGRTSDAARAANRLGAGFKDMLKSQLAWLLGGALIFGTVFKIQQAFTEAVKTILDFRQAIIDVGAITEASSREMGLLEEAARGVATSSKMGFLEAAEALKILGQAGLTARDSAEALKTVAMMVTATGASTADSVKVLTTAMNVWGLSAKDSMRVANVMAAALNYSKLEIGDLATSFNYLASTAAQVGMSLEETVASIAVLSNMGLRASTIGTGLRGVIGQLIAPTKEFKDQLHALGLAVDDVRMPANNLFDSLRKLSKAGMDMGQIFEGLEKRQAAMLTSMLNAGAEAFERMRERISGTNAMLVMFERSMEGPMARLIMFKNRLLDVALDFTGVLIPALEMGIRAFTALIMAVKDLGPIYALAGAIKAFQYLLGTTIVTVNGLSVAMTRLGAALTWLRANPIFTALALLTAGYMAVKMAMERETMAREERIRKMDREIQATIKQTAELENMVEALKSGNLNEIQARDLVAGLAKEYGFLNEAATQHGVNVEKAISLAIKKVRELDQELKDQKLQRLVEESKKLYEIWKQIDDINKRAPKEGPAQPPEGSLLANHPLVRQAQRMHQARQEAAQKASAPLKEAMEKETEAMKPLLAAYTNLTAAQFKAMMAGKGFTEGLIKEVEAIRQEVILSEQAAKAAKDKQMREYQDKELAAELLRLNEENADAYQNLENWRKKELDKAGSERTAQATEYRLKVEEIYQKKLLDLIEADRKKGLETSLKAFNQEADERKKSLEGELADIKLYYAGEEEIRRTALIKIKLLQLENERARRNILYAAVVPGKTKEGEDIIDPGKALVNIQKLQTDYVEKEKGIMAKANDDIAKLQAAQARERAKAEREAQRDIRQTRQETARAMISLAKTERDEIAAQDMITNARVEEENEKHFDRLIDYYKKHATDAEELTATGDALVEAEIRRHNVTVAQITQEGEKAKKEATDRYTSAYIKDQKRIMQGNIDEAVRYQALSLRALERQYDDLSDTVRNSEYGKVLKRDISELTIDVYQKHRDAYAAAAEIIGQKFPKDSAVAQAAIAELMEGVERYNARVREARRYLAEFAETHQDAWHGMVAGFRDFSNRLRTEYESEREAARLFGESVYEAIRSPLEDLFIGDLKTFDDYWRNWCKNLAKVFSQMTTDMIFQWVGLKQAMSGQSGAFWGSGLGSLLGLFGLGGGGSAGVGAGLGGGPAPVGAGLGAPGAGIGAHTGGLVKDLLERIPKRHSGGSGLSRDEVLVKMLADEYVLNSRATRSLGKGNLDYMNQTGKVPGNLVINVPVNVEGDKRLASRLRSEVEFTVRRLVTEYSR